MHAYGGLFWVKIRYSYVLYSGRKMFLKEFAMVKKDLGFSIQYPDSEKAQTPKVKQDFDIDEYDPEEVAKMRKQAETIIKLTKAMGVNTADSTNDSAAASAAQPQSAAPSHMTREQYRADMANSSHPNARH